MKTAVIIGGGASGFMAAITLAQQYKNNDLKIIILERMDRVGKKLLATGNGTCNITNSDCSAERYHGDTAAAQTVIEKFTPQMATSFFASIGVVCTKKEDGRIYPYSRQASSVLDCLRSKATGLNIEERCKSEVVGIKKAGKGFLLSINDNSTVRADVVIVAFGGKTAPSLGGASSGYELMRQLGHNVTKLSPALVQLKTDTAKIRALKGVKTDAEISLVQDGKVINRQFGELLFTEYGISGPPVLQLSRPVGVQKGRFLVNIDFMPDYDKKELEKLLFTRRNHLSKVTLENFFTGMLNKRIGQAVIKTSLEKPLSALCNELSDNELIILAKSIKNFQLSVNGTLSWQNAQVTAGGVPAKEFDLSCMQSKLCKGLFAAGELINVDGDCGGFNLQWAWSSGHIAGCGAAAYLKNI